MEFRFKVQPYQTQAVEAVADCFAGQPKGGGQVYRIAPGQVRTGEHYRPESEYEGFRNADLELSEDRILENVRKVQRRQNLPVSQSLTDFTTYNNRGERVPVPAAYRKAALAAAPVHLDVEMETGTGKTYCYIKTVFEMNRRYGWSKFIVMVPSVAIREGVYKSLQITADHFMESYGRRARVFIYDSRRLHELESFSSDSGINVMVINIQAFNARGRDNRRIYEELDDFQSRRPIDVIASNRPIVILDEPQKMEGTATMESLAKFRALFILRYSATHRTQHCRVHRLDALDAYNQKLVKKIAVRGIEVRGLSGTGAWLYLEGMDISEKAPVARVEMEVKRNSGEIVRRVRRLAFRDDLFDLSRGLEQYRGFTVSQIDCTSGTVEFTNGVMLKAGEAHGDVSEDDIRRIQIRETIRTHLDRERQLFTRGIKVLSLFFIDAVVKYRDYDADEGKGEYARIFEEEYERLRDECLSEPGTGNEAYRTWLGGIDTGATHNGYFSVDRKTGRMRDPAAAVRGKSAGLSDDVDAYDLILRDKERLLSFDEPVRFIFSHSALREGWDNPNVFVMCMLKHSDNTVSRRQEVGRGLRLCIDQHGERMDAPATVHDINVLTVVASESYSDFVAGLQTEIAQALSSRPRKADEEYFTGKVIETAEEQVEITPRMAKQIYHYLVKNEYTDEDDRITCAWREAKAAGMLADLPENMPDILKVHADQVFGLIDSVDGNRLPEVGDGRKTRANRLNANFKRKEFRELWARINRKAVYRVEFDTPELVGKCIDALNGRMHVTPLQYVVRSGVQGDGLTDSRIRDGDAFTRTGTRTEQAEAVPSLVKYDLVGKVAEETHLTRKTVADILGEIEPSVFAQFGQNPEHFIAGTSRIITEQKAAMVIERLAYDETDERYDVDIFTAAQTGQDFSRATEKLRNHIYDHAITESGVERDFVSELDASSEVVVYAKLPRGFLIPTPVGDYNPDWAIAFRTGSVRHVCFVAETKGTLSALELRGVEEAKIACARKFFDEISRHIAPDRVKYDVVTDYAGLMDIVGGAP